MVKYKEWFLFKLSDLCCIHPANNVKMPATVGILTFMRSIISCSVKLSMKNILLPLGQTYIHVYVGIFFIKK